MSKQANQKYRKEKEREHLKKAGIDVSQSAPDKKGREENKNQHI